MSEWSTVVTALVGGGAMAAIITAVSSWLKDRHKPAIEVADSIVANAKANADTALDMAKLAREENAELRQRVAALEARLQATLDELESCETWETALRVHWDILRQSQTPPPRPVGRDPPPAR